MRSFVRVSQDVYINPDKVELILLERESREGVVHEKPFVVVGFVGGAGRALPPEIDIQDVVDFLETRTDWEGWGPNTIGENHEATVNQYFNSAPKATRSLMGRLKRAGRSDSHAS